MKKCRGNTTVSRILGRALQQRSTYIIQVNTGKTNSQKKGPIPNSSRRKGFKGCGRIFQRENGGDQAMWELKKVCSIRSNLQKRHIFQVRERPFK